MLRSECQVSSHELTHGIVTESREATMSLIAACKRISSSPGPLLALDEATAAATAADGPTAPYAELEADADGCGYGAAAEP
jgi:hypothetical protein